MGWEANLNSLDDQIAAYDAMRDVLEMDCFGKWVVFHRRRLAGTYECFQEAAADAVSRFGRGPYLIRQVGAPPLSLPPSILFQTL